MSEQNKKPSAGMRKQVWIYAGVLVIITIAAMIYGTMTYAVPMAKRISQSIGEDTEAGVTGSGRSFGNTGNGRIEKNGKTGSWDPDAGSAIRRISIEADYLDLHVVSGDAFHAEWNVNEKVSDVYVTIKGSELRVVEKGKVRFLFNLGIGTFSNTPSSELTLTVPDSICLDNLEIEVDLGSITAEGVKSRNTEINADCGSIELRKTDLGNLNLEADCGDVELDRVTATDAAVQADLGSIAVTDGNMNKLRVEADCGQIDCRRIKAEYVELDDNCGSITVSGDFASLKAFCDLGSITVETDRPEEDVDLDLKTALGTVTVNGDDK